MKRYVRLIAAEGARSLSTRIRERVREAVHDASARARGAQADRVPQSPILNFVAMPFVRRLGGVPTLLWNRFEEERRLRPVAMLAPSGRHGALWSAEPEWAVRRTAFPGGGDALVDPRFERAIEEARAITGARVLHVENAYNVPFESLLALMDRGLGLVLTLSDYSLYCVRPHLSEEPIGDFCGFSRDEARCERCLRHDRDPARVQLAKRRAAARHLLLRASAVVFPSSVVQLHHEQLFGPPAGLVRVIEPGVPGTILSRAPGTERRRIALVGAVKRHKGAHLLPEIVRQVGRDSGVEWHVFGGGDAELLEAIRRVPGTIVHGYYESSELPRLLAKSRIDLGMLLSIWPETFGLTLSECWQAGVPVIAFDTGAIGERIARKGGGWLVPSGEGAAGFARVIRDWLSGSAVPDTPREITFARDAADAHLALYRELGIVEP